MNRIKYFCYFLCCCFLFLNITVSAQSSRGIVVLETDFGLKDGAVSEVKGVMYSVDRSLILSDLTHQIPPFNIWEASYRLYQAAPYWPKGTVFVSVIDPGVGTSRKSIVALSNNGYYFVTPDNGTLTMVADKFGIKEVREIDETQHRLKGSKASYTFYGRDLYGYTGARLSAGKINFNSVGPILKTPLVKIPYQKAYEKENTLYGTIVVLDPEYGNVWTNIDRGLVNQFGMKIGKNYHVRIYERNIKKYDGMLPFQNTFGEVSQSKSMLYLNSLLNLSIGTNQRNFAKDHHVSSGGDWRIEISQ